MLKITHPITGDEIQVGMKDISMDMRTFDDDGQLVDTRQSAIDNIKKLGNGWRLPTIEELEEMYKLHEKGEGNFEDNWYWTDGTYGIYFGDGEVDSGVDECLASARPVRNINN